MSETKELKTVGDVLAWAFDQLGIKMLIAGSPFPVNCCCLANFACGEVIRECKINKEMPCDTSDYETKPSTITAPPKFVSQWTQEPPTAKGLYWIFYKDKPVLVEIYYDDSVDECGLYVKTCARGWSSFTHRLDTFLQNEPHLQWRKVDMPPLPEK